MDPEARRKQPRNACTEYAYDDIADEAKPVTLDEQAGEPSCDGTDHDPGEDGFGGKHRFLPCGDHRSSTGVRHYFLSGPIRDVAPDPRLVYYPGSHSPEFAVRGRVPMAEQWRP